jgi:hypothetical protein
MDWLAARSVTHQKSSDPRLPASGCRTKTTFGAIGGRWIPPCQDRVTDSGNQISLRCFHRRQSQEFGLCRVAGRTARKPSWKEAGPDKRSTARQPTARGRVQNSADVKVVTLTYIVVTDLAFDQSHMFLFVD